MSVERIRQRHKVERVIADGMREVEWRRVAFFDDPAEPETMHKLRVSIRTLRSLVAFVKPFQAAGQNRAVQTALRDVVRETSRLRELDVLYAQVVGLGMSASPELLDACAAARAAECDRVSAVLAGKKTAKLLRTAREGALAVEWKKRVATCGLSRDDVVARFDALVFAEGERLDALDKRDPEATHDARKKAKQVRYVATKLAPLLRDDAPEVAGHMKLVQDELGALCDARVNLQIISEFPRAGLPLLAHRNLDDLALVNQVLVDAALASR